MTESRPRKTSSILPSPCVHMNGGAQTHTRAGKKTDAQHRRTPNHLFFRAPSATTKEVPVAQWFSVNSAVQSRKTESKQHTSQTTDVLCRREFPRNSQRERRNSTANRKEDIGRDK